MNNLEKLVNSGSIDLLKEALEQQFDPHDLENAFIDASGKRNKEIVKILLDYGADIHFHGEIPLVYATLTNDLDWIKYLISLGSDPTLLSKKSVKHIIHESKAYQIIDYLIDSGMPISENLLELTAEEEKLKSFKLLYKRMPDADLSKSWSIACFSSSMEIIDYLLDLPLEFDLTDKHLIKNVIECYEIGILKKIISRTPDPKALFHLQHLKIACDIKSYDVVKVLLELGLDPNIPIGMELDKRHRRSVSPLEFALTNYTERRALFTYSPKPNIRIIKLLLDYGAKVDYYCLESAIATDNWDIFHLIYQTGQWTMNEISNALTAAIEMCENEKIWKFLHNQIGDDLDPNDLPCIISTVLEDNQYEKFEYFADFYGKDMLLDKIDLQNSIINECIHQKNFHTIEYLVKFYGKGVVSEMINPDMYEDTIKIELKKILD